MHGCCCASRNVSHVRTQPALSKQCQRQSSNRKHTYKYPLTFVYHQRHKWHLKWNWHHGISTASSSMTQLALTHSRVVNASRTARSAIHILCLASIA
jgi:hypothetical protein